MMDEDIAGLVEQAVRDNDLEWFQIIESFMGFHPVSMTDALNQGIAKVQKWQEERERLRKWVDDLQSGMYINCVYCGHRYGPQDKVPATMGEALKKHVENCPDHPMSALKRRLKLLEHRVKAQERLHRPDCDCELCKNPHSTEMCERMLAQLRYNELSKCGCNGIQMCAKHDMDAWHGSRQDKAAVAELQHELLRLRGIAFHGEPIGKDDEDGQEEG
jgi:DNA-directed RNA polymerase subunit RPC12/RpoP